jgi:hypothetical protein
MPRATASRVELQSSGWVDNSKPASGLQLELAAKVQAVESRDDSWEIGGGHLQEGHVRFQGCHISFQGLHHTEYELGPRPLLVGGRFEALNNKKAR